ncbi:WD40-repeat-containing domain protein [Dichomitus squalens]|nr:WD40-repeat-containing domain protein [Dichomitus squalens]
MRIAAAYKEGKLCVWNLRKAADTSHVKVVQFSPKGALLLSVWKATGEVDIWNSISGEWLRCLSLGGQDKPYRATTARFSPDGRYVASVSEDGTVLWSTVAVFAEHPDSVTRLAFSPDGRLLVSGAEDGSLCIRDLRELEFSGWIQV